MPERGKYIVLEGGDGVGKSTQAKMLEATLRTAGYDTLRVVNDETGALEPIQEPGGTIAANILRQRIKDAAVQRTPRENLELFTEARISIWRDAIEPALNRGQHVITARNWFSTLAYQGYGEGLSIEEIEDYTRERVGEAYMYPNFVAILAIKEEAARRARMVGRDASASALDTFESKPDSFQDSMQSGYLQLAKDRHVPVIDASGSRLEVFGRIIDKVAPLFDNYQSEKGA